MIWLLVALIVVGLIVALASRHDATPVVQPKGDCGSCDGSPQAECEQICMMRAATKEVEYYDDEELDAYQGRPADAYTDDEAEQFREVLLTMRQEEVAGWCRSLTLRGIEPPNQIKDEIVLLRESATDSATRRQ